MSKVVIPPARCQAPTTLVRVGKATKIHLIDGSFILYWNDIPVAVSVGSCIYHHIPEPSGALTKVLAKSAATHALIQLDADQFDFVVGNLFTRVGLSLTRAPSQ